MSAASGRGEDPVRHGGGSSRFAGRIMSVNIAVVGLGGLGSAAAYWLARRGADVTGFEQFELGHVRGASHDHSRIIRRTYHTGATSS